MFVQYSQGLCFKQTSADDTGAMQCHLLQENTTVHKTKKTNMCLFDNLTLFMKYALDSKKVNGSSLVRIILFWNCPVNKNV
jgi:hypothetical protein